MEETIQQILTIRDQVANIVRKKIIKRELQSGERISERAVSEMLNVSTTPVKEAFRMLVTEGLLITVPRKGTYVSEFSEQKFREMAYLRAAIEGVAVYFAVESITPEEIAAMDKNLCEASVCLENKDVEGVISANVRFHEILHNASRNQYLINMLLMLRSMDYAVLLPTLNKDHEARIRDHMDHCEVADAIRNKDAVKAERCIRKHIQRVNDYALGIIGDCESKELEQKKIAQYFPQAN